MTSDKGLRVAIIGSGPSGISALRAISSSISDITVFERKSESGGLWVPSTTIPQLIPQKDLDGVQPVNGNPLGIDQGLYPTLESNVPDPLMSFVDDPIPESKVFHHHSIVLSYLQKVTERYSSYIKYKTSVERVTKNDFGNFEIEYRDVKSDQRERNVFDAVIVAAGHYSIPVVPPQFQSFIGDPRLQHTVQFREVDDYIGKKILVVGTGISACDFVSTVKNISEVVVSSRGNVRADFRDSLEGHVEVRGEVKVVKPDNDKLVIEFENGQLETFDLVILATGYIYHYPFLRDLGVEIVNNKYVKDTYQHIFWQKDPKLSFVGLVTAGITFRVFDYQSLVIAKYLQSTIELPTVEVQKRWEEERLAQRGVGAFHAIPPDFEQYFTDLVRLGELDPKYDYDPVWLDILDKGRQQKIAWWKRNNTV